MTLKINSLAPDFTAETSEGKLSFHEWLGDSWGVLFSHPKDFTPVCTTELGALAKMKPEFEKRNVKVMGLSVDPVSDHVKWLEDIKDVCGLKPNYPIVADEKLEVIFSLFAIRQDSRVNYRQFLHSQIWELLQFLPTNSDLERIIAEVFSGNTKITWPNILPMPSTSLEEYKLLYNLQALERYFLKIEEGEEKEKYRNGFKSGGNILDQSASKR